MKTRVIVKPQRVREILAVRLCGVFMFKSLTIEELNKVIDAVEEKKLSPGEFIVR